MKPSIPAELDVALTAGTQRRLRRGGGTERIEYTDTSPTDSSPTGQFADRTVHRQDSSPTGQFAERTVRRQDSSSTGHFGDRKFRRQVGSPTGRLAIRIKNEHY